MLITACARGTGGVIVSSKGGGGSGGTVTPPARSQKPPFTPALLAAAAGSGSVRVDYAIPAEGFEGALFWAVDAAAVYLSIPLELPPGDHTIVEGLPDGIEQFFGLGIRAAGTSSYEPVGAVIRAKPGAPIYVDAAASAQGADGLTPATAFPDLLSAFLTAAFLGGGNVWILDGSYSAGGTLVFPGIHVYGGFGESFDLSSRDARGGRTVLVGVAGQQILAIPGGPPAAVIDGLQLDGEGVFSIGIDADNSPVELRSIVVRRFTGRGVRLRNSSVNSSLDVTIVGSEFSANGGDGVSGNGAFDVRIDASSFDTNTQEGLDFDDLIALSDETARFEVTGCRFFGNGAEGLDIDLEAPAIPGPVGGRFRVIIRGCRFELNALDGVLIDEDYELVPGWTAEITITESTARANSGSGFHVDVDARSAVTLHRLITTGNKNDGITVSSESEPGFAVVSASVAAGNLGAGLRVLDGNVAVLASHCVFAGNAGGGMISEIVTSTVASSIAYLQPDPWRGQAAIGSVEITDPSEVAFRWAPRRYAQITSRSPQSFTLLDPGDIAVGDDVEVADDGLLRRVVTVAGAAITLSTEPEAFLLPGLLTVFPIGNHVIENYRLEPGSTVLGRGFAAPGAPLVDPGVFGAPSPGEPGFPDVISRDPLLLLRSVPALTATIGSTQSLELGFSANLDPASVTTNRVRVLTVSGRQLQVGVAAIDERLVITPPAGGWGNEALRFELHDGIHDTRGSAFASPLILHLDPR